MVRPTWEELIDRGAMIDVSYEAQSVGMMHPAAITSGVWLEYVELAGDWEGPGAACMGQDRARVILAMARLHLIRWGFYCGPLSFYVPGHNDDVDVVTSFYPHSHGCGIVIALPNEKWL